MATLEVKKYPLQQVLELACAAQRCNNSYIKTVEAIFSIEENSKAEVMAYRHANRTLMLVALGEDKTTYSDPKSLPRLISTNLKDKALAEEIQKFYRKLAFSAIQGESEFLTELNGLLNSTEVALNKFGFIACLPSVYARDLPRTQIKKQARTCEAGFLAEVGENVFDLDCEILESVKSKNFEAFNITAIISNKMVSWMSKTSLDLGACVVVKAKVKDHTKHWKHDNDVTRLNYVKAEQ